MKRTKFSLTFHDGGCYHIETSPLICFFLSNNEIKILENLRPITLSAMVFLSERFMI